MLPSPLPATIVATLLNDYGTPLYLYDASEIRLAWQNFRAAFPYPHKEIHYAIVCNKNPYLVGLLRDLGARIHANTPGDAFAALSAGVPPDKILYSGTNLDAADMQYLLGHDLSLILDSLDQVRLRAQSPAPTEGDPQSRGFGLRLWLPEGAPRIGLDPSEIPQALEMARNAGLAIEGLHMYTATNNGKVEKFVAAFERLAAASSLLPDVRYLDLGGGYGVDYRRQGNGLDLERLGRVISDGMARLSAERGRPITLILEPGRILVARSGALLVRVVSVKMRQGRRSWG